MDVYIYAAIFIAWVVVHARQSYLTYSLRMGIEDLKKMNEMITLVEVDDDGNCTFKKVPKETDNETKLSKRKVFMTYICVPAVIIITGVLVSVWFLKQELAEQQKQPY
jgi:uncharacterized ion transporter superfamily protein YfcC